MNSIIVKPYYIFPITLYCLPCHIRRTYFIKILVINIFVQDR